MFIIEQRELPIGAILEILTNPYDLRFLIIEHTRNRFGFIVTRGPSECYGMIFQTHGFAETYKETVETIEELLKSTYDAVVTYPGGPENFFAELTKGTYDVPVMDLMDTAFIDRIVDTLHTEDSALTYEWEN